jgi:hypothetical protein
MRPPNKGTERIQKAEFQFHRPFFGTDRLDLNHPPTSVLPLVGVVTSEAHLCRPDLNNPPTAVTPVGGISEFSRRLGSDLVKVRYTQIHCDT